MERLGTLRGKGPGVKRLVLDAVGVAAPDDPPAAAGVPLTVRPALLTKIRLLLKKPK